MVSIAKTSHVAAAFKAGLKITIAGSILTWIPKTLAGWVAAYKKDGILSGWNSEFCARFSLNPNLPDLTGLFIKLGLVAPSEDSKVGPIQSAINWLGGEVLGWEVALNPNNAKEVGMKAATCLAFPQTAKVTAVLSRAWQSTVVTDFFSQKMGVTSFQMTAFALALIAAASFYAYNQSKVKQRKAMEEAAQSFGYAIRDVNAALAQQELTMQYYNAEHREGRRDVHRRQARSLAANLPEIRRAFDEIGPFVMPNTRSLVEQDLTATQNIATRVGPPLDPAPENPSPSVFNRGRAEFNMLTSVASGVFNGIFGVFNFVIDRVLNLPRSVVKVLYR